jgi:hypothetical protein
MAPWVRHERLWQDQAVTGSVGPPPEYVADQSEGYR